MTGGNVLFCGDTDDVRTVIGRLNLGEKFVVGARTTLY